MVEDTIVHVNKALTSGSRMLIEGANAAMLDIDFGEGNEFCFPCDPDYVIRIIKNFDPEFCLLQNKVVKPIKK